jgi:hypothetical protein
MRRNTIMKSVAMPLAISALALVMSACGAGRAGSEGSAEAEPSLEVTLEVENQNFYDARIYVLESGTRTRLGSVPGNSTQAFRFRARIEQAQFVVDFVGSGEFTTTPIQVSPGDRVVLTVTASSHRFRFGG